MTHTYKGYELTLVVVVRVANGLMLFQGFSILHKDIQS